MDNVNYTENDIDQLEGAVRVRKRPASVLGSNGLAGAQHGVIEMYGNSADEASAGYGDKLQFKRYADGSISLRDFGRGVPLGWNEVKQSYNWHLVYNELYSGGKYRDNQDKLARVTDWSTFNSKDYNYLYSVGLNGLGAASTQYTSEFFDVISIRQGDNGKNYKYEMHFLEGLPVIDGKPINVHAEKYDMTQYHQEVVETDEPTGTFVHWKPDAKVFTDVNITADWLFNLCKDIAYVGHIDLEFEDEESGRKEYIKAGDLEQLMVSTYGDHIMRDSEDNLRILNIDGFNHGHTMVEGGDYIWVAECNIVLATTDGTECDNMCFHNIVRMHSGEQYNAINYAIRSFVGGIAKSKGVSLKDQDYDGVFVTMISSFANYASFRGQTKDAVDDIFIYNFLKDIIYNKLQVEYSKGNPMITDAVDKIINNASIRVQMQEAEKHIRSIKQLQKRQKDPEKFITCREYKDKKYDRTELWITEGDSAKDSVGAARDSNFQAIYPIRGKGLNVAKSSIQKILGNKEITDIITLIGTGIDLNLKGQKLFNINDLRFDKIILATDADVDGYQIRVLLFVLFYRLAPQLLTEGHVYIAETPRYAIKFHNGTTKYAIDEADRDRIIRSEGASVATISRFKGLGEVNAKVLRDTTVGVAGRHLVPLTVDLKNELEIDLIDALFGADKHKQRKEILTTVLGEAVAKEMMENSMLLSEIDDEDIEEDTEIEEWA